MVRNQYNEQLSLLKKLLAEMGNLNSSAIEYVAKELKAPSDASALSEKIRGIEKSVDEKESEIERLCLKLIIRQQPVAGDLLFITSAMKMITDMERIADQAADISELLLKKTDCRCAVPKEMFVMAEAVQKMVAGVMYAFTAQSAEKAREICRADDVVDECFLKIKAKLTLLMHSNCEEESGNERALDMLMIAKYFERIGDHAVNVAEWVLFSLTGEHKKLG